MIAEAALRQATLTPEEQRAILIDHDRLDGYLNLTYRALKSDRTAIDRVPARRCRIGAVAARRDLHLRGQGAALQQVPAVGVARISRSWLAGRTLLPLG